MKLAEVIQDIVSRDIIGTVDIQIQKICFDSRQVCPQTLFIAMRGTLSDGHDYIEKAVNLGAVAVICEQLPQDLTDSVTYIVVEDSSKALAMVASNWYGNPSQKVKLVGVTGTNGKTTVATLLYRLAKKMGFSSGLISTVENRIDDTVLPSTHTTPDALRINELLFQMVECGVEYVFMEVSSHGIAQNRIEGLQFVGGIFTNLTHDHLDYHKTFSAYRDTKKKFFDQLPRQAFALVNLDDKNGAFMLQNTKAKKLTYALRTFADFKGQILECDKGGMQLRFDSFELWTRLIGKFNAYNLLAIYGAALSLGWNREEVLLHLSVLEAVSGRFQYQVSQTGVIAVVDYAHTPDALQNVLETLRDIRTFKERLITVVGCGGNRDRQKRPRMAQIAVELSDDVILTSDNPRDEDPDIILDDMEAGIYLADKSKVLRITDRKQALQVASKMASRGDIILVAGKGHETYQEIRGVRYEFDDFKMIREFLKSYK